DQQGPAQEAAGTDRRLRRTEQSPPPDQGGSRQGHGGDRREDRPERRGFLQSRQPAALQGTWLSRHRAEKFSSRAGSDLQYPRRARQLSVPVGYLAFRLPA